MKRIFLAILATATILGFSACRKEVKQLPADPEKITGTNELSATAPAAAACGFRYLALTVSPNGQSRLWAITNSPGNPAIFVNPVNGSAGNNIIGFTAPGGGGIPFMTGISYEPATNLVYGTTGAVGPLPNRLIRFSLANPNVTVNAPVATCGGVALNLSDIERNQVTGQYLAINRSGAALSNRILQINVGAPSATCLAATIPVGIQLRGLTYDCGGRIQVMQPVAATGNVYALTAAGGIGAGPFPYPGVVTTAGVGTPEIGLHWDCVCINRLITGSGNQPNPLLTDGLPAALGGPIYFAAPTPVAIPAIVDFARWN